MRRAAIINVMQGPGAADEDHPINRTWGHIQELIYRPTLHD